MPHRSRAPVASEEDAGSAGVEEDASKRLLCAAVLAALVVVGGTVIADDAIETPYLVIEAQIADQDMVGLVPGGWRGDGDARGAITDGMLPSASTIGIDYLVLRPDGVGIIDARWFVADADGLTAAITLKGFIGEPSEPFGAMLDPAFEVPDVDIPLHGAAWLRTMAPQDAFVNHTVFGFTATINMDTGLLRLTGHSLAP